MSEGKGVMTGTKKATFISQQNMNLLFKMVGVQWKFDFPTSNGGMQNESSVEKKDTLHTRFLHALEPTCMLSQCL